MSVRGPRAFPIFSSETVLDAVMEFEELMGRPAYKEPHNSVKALEKAATRLDPSRHKTFDPSETMFWSRVMADATGRQPMIVTEVYEFLTNIWADVLNVVVFQIRPTNDDKIRKFLLAWHSMMLADQQTEFDRWNHRNVDVWYFA